jgi:hypothetical protein
MKQFLWILGVLAFGLSQAQGAPKNYGVATVGYNDFDATSASDKALTYGLAFGKQVHQQWYAELGYLNLFDYSENGVDAEGDALYLAMLGKASGGSGELFYKLGVARVDIASETECLVEGLASRCATDDGIAAGLVGLGFDYYVSLKSLVRLEYVHMTGEDSFSTNMINLGFRYNFN